MKGYKTDWVLITDKPFDAKTHADLEEHGFGVIKVFECEGKTIILTKFQPEKIWEKELR